MAIQLVSTLLLFSSLVITVIDAKVAIRPEPFGDVGIMAGESRYYQCISSNKNEKLFWLDPQGREISNKSDNRVYTIYKKNTIKLELKNLNKQHSGQYKCVSRNEQNQETSSAQFMLHVYNPTQVKASKTTYQVNEGNSVRMECIVTSDKDAAIEFMWTFSDNPKDLSQDPKYRIDVSRERTSNDEVLTISRLDIRNVTKENDGEYICSVDTTTRFISDSKELKLTLRVQFKPRFDERTSQHIWVSEEAVQQGGPITVNISCMVNADPIAEITWFSFDNRPIDTSRNYGGILARIYESENLSTLELTFPNIDEIRNPRSNSRIKYKCRAQNTQGADTRQFEIKIGRIPDSPMVVGLDYKDGAIILELNETNVEPPIDVYRLEISGEQIHLFNKSHTKDNTTYVIDIGLPRGEHKVNIYAHNPVGWSEQPYSSYYLQVVSAGYRPSSIIQNEQWFISYLIMLVITFSLMQSQSTSSLLSTTSSSSSS